MACRNCGRSAPPLYDVVLLGESRIEVTLCARCRDDYAELGWVGETEPAGDGSE